MIQGITNICSRLENTNIDLMSATSVFMMQVVGASQQKIDAALAEARQIAFQGQLKTSQQQLKTSQQ